MKRLVSALIVLGALAGSPVRSQAPPIAGVTRGQVRGIALPGGGAAFKGIPYAQPPVDDLRWREPAPVQSWNGLRDALAFGPPCAQSAMLAPSLAGAKAFRFAAENAAVFTRPDLASIGAASFPRRVAN